MPKRSIAETKRLIEVASGRRAADYYLANGRIVNVYSGEVIEGNVATSGERIAYVGPSDTMVGSGTKVVDARGDYLIPGFFDPHAHADLLFNPASFSDQVVVTGTTAVFADNHDLANSLGLKGLRRILRDSKSYPLKFYVGLPAVSPPFPDFEGEDFYPLGNLYGLLEDEVALAISEITPFVRLVRGDRRLLSKITLARNAGKRVEGHTVGASYDKLNAIIDAGVTSCHESIKPEDLLNRLRLGLYVMLRHGSIRSDLQFLLRALRETRGMSSNRVMLATDGVFAEDLVSRGYMDYLVSEAIKYGIEPIEAVRMATLNPATYFGLDWDLGGIAPSRFADISVAKDLRKPTPRLVMERGRIVAKEGKLTVDPSPLPLIGLGDRPFVLGKIDENLFAVPSRTRERVRVPVIHIADKTVTERRDVQLKVRKGAIQADPERDVLKIVLVQRDGKRKGCGFLSGFGAKIGGIASSIAHDTHNLMVIGGDDEDMTIALDRVIQIKGGIVLAKGKKIIHELPLPIGGTMSPLPIRELAHEVGKLKRVFRDLGCPLEDPIWTMGFLSFTGVVEVRITLSGVYDVKKGRVVF
ncbi:MAG: adenine deaminase C-terminal domain-containing protein [Thermodesulfobacteriota bacterium]